MAGRRKEEGGKIGGGKKQERGATRNPVHSTHMSVFVLKLENNTMVRNDNVITNFIKFTKHYPAQRHQISKYSCINL